MSEVRREYVVDLSDVPVRSSEGLEIALHCYRAFPCLSQLPAARTVSIIPTTSG